MSERLTKQIAFRCSDELYDLIQRIAERERRKANEVTRVLVEKGVAVYMQSGELYEPKPLDEVMPVIKARVVASRITARVPKTKKLA